MGDVKAEIFITTAKKVRLYSILEALKDYEILFANEDIQISHISTNSKDIREGSLFICIKGFVNDGHDYIQEAIEKGASCIVAQKYIKNLKKNIPYCIVKDTRKALAKIAGLFYDYPSKKLKLIGITGTNGKTTTSFFISSILKAAGIKASRLSTITYRLNEFIEEESKLTTPDVLDLQRLLAESFELKNEFVVMEVSSHALALGRVDECFFDIGIYTNLGYDHLDFHRTIEEYLKAKISLFSHLKEKSYALINIDDKYSKELIKNIKTENINGYGIYQEKILGLKKVIKPCEIKLSYPTEIIFDKTCIKLKLLGLPNVYNALAAIATGRLLGIEMNMIKQGLEDTVVPGRFQILDIPKPYKVIIDYAHTPEAMKAVLKTTRVCLKPNRVITIFGCGGNRSKEKRPFMGEIASLFSDIVIITSDNPRYEKLDDIIKDILKGISKDNYKIIKDRREAIEYGLKLAEPNDAVLILGKGHEKYQIFGDKKLPFNDTEVVYRILNQ